MTSSTATTASSSRSVSSRSSGSDGSMNMHMYDEGGCMGAPDAETGSMMRSFGVAERLSSWSSSACLSYWIGNLNLSTVERYNYNEVDVLEAVENEQESAAELMTSTMSGNVWMSSTLKKRKKKMNKHKLQKRRKRERARAGKRNA